MKKAKTKQRFSLSAVVLAAALMVSGFASCSKSETELSPDGSRAISLSANVQGTTQTRAAVDGTSFPANTPNVFRLTAYSGTAAPSNWSAPYFNDIQVNSGAASALTLVTKQYYPANGDKVYFYGYAPSATLLAAGTTSAPIANYTITGQEDIMAAQEVTGIAKATTGTQSQPDLAFTHKLMQVRFKIVKDASFEANKKVTEILVKGVKTSAKLNIGTGVLTFDGVADQNLSLPITAGTKDEITTNGTEMDSCVMLEPVGTNGTITLKVIADGVTYDNISVALTGTDNGKAGTSHLITLTFKRVGITPTATITDWKSPVDKDINIDGDGLRAPAIGDFINGGIVYWVDGANYKVVSLEVASTKWAESDAYVVGGARSDADGRVNSKAIRDYFEANSSTVGTDFDAAFPAVAECYNYTGKDGTDPKGTWYLPAKSELQYLWCAFNGKAPISWPSGTHTDAQADLTAQVVFNQYLTNAGGTSITSGYFWSSTEYSTITSLAWYVLFSDGSTSYASKGNLNGYVRCVKHITPPPVVGDYYYSDGSYSAAFDAKKTATGMIYYVNSADPTKFKVVSLEELSTQKWAASNTYVVSGAQSDTDGKANSDAIKAAFDAKTAGVAITESTFDAAFPAASYCYNYRGKAGSDALGSWYLPAKSELQYLCCAYNGKAPISWEFGTNPLVPADATAQADFNKYLTDAGGGVITGDYYWSSSEYSSIYSWFVDLGDGYTTNDSKTNTFRVRCVRDI